MSTLTEISRIGFTLARDEKGATEWFVEVSEWSDGKASVYAERKTDEIWMPGQMTDYDGIMFDHAPNAAEILDELEHRLDIETDAAATAWYARLA